MDAAQFAKILGVSITPSSASLRLCGRIWFVGDGAFAPEVWGRSASRPYLGPFDLRGFVPFAGRFQNGRGLPLLQCPPPCLRAFVRVPVFFISETAVSPSLRLWVLAGGFADKTARSNQEEVFWRYSRANWRMISKRGKSLFFLRLRRCGLGGVGTLDGEFFGH